MDGHADRRIEREWITKRDRVDRLTEREREGERVVDRRETKKEKGERVGIAGTWEKVL